MFEDGKGGGAVAKGGEHDPILLREAVLKALRGQPGTSGP